MEQSLLATFIEQDCTPHDRALVLDALDRACQNQPPARQLLEFNRFEFSFDAEKHVVSIEDILDTTERGSQIVSFAELKAALSATP